jgi:DNA-binding NarL/FixJ family response regulator
MAKDETPLTTRQLEITEGIRRNLSYREIGAELRISEHTVRAHVRTIALLLPNPDDLEPRVVIQLWARHRHWIAQRRRTGGDDPPLAATG